MAVDLSNAVSGWDCFWQGLGVAGAVIFFGRFYLQWIASELKHESVVPVGFWYMSSVGSLMLLAYGVYSQSPVGVLSYSFNMVVYARNLVHIWRAKGGWTRFRSVLFHSSVGVVLMIAVCLVVYTWRHEYESTRAAAASAALRNWLWIGVGVFGQGLFACRFLLQWLVTEVKRQSVIPVAFWYISLVAAVLMMASYSQQSEWLYTIGVGSTLAIYARNLWLIHLRKAPAPE